MPKVAIIGSHGLYAKYGGWDQLVRNLAEKKSSRDIEYIIFNSREAPKVIQFIPEGVVVRRINLKASGFEGIFYDFYSILVSYFRVDSLLLLGAQGIPIIILLRLFKKKNVVVNVGGLEWERPKFNFLAKAYLKICFHLSYFLSTKVILDNEYYLNLISSSRLKKSVVIPYGGEISYSLDITPLMQEKYPFLNSEYFLSISRALEDNYIDELCHSFIGINKKLVLISNFDSSEYGKNVYAKYSEFVNIILINGLYIKHELDLIRRNCTAYIHTHTLCGTAPSLVEMIISRRPIVSIDVPQNRFTLENSGVYFRNFRELKNLLYSFEFFVTAASTPEALLQKYSWNKIINKYQELF